MIGVRVLLNVEVNQMVAESRTAVDRVTVVLTTLSGHPGRDLTEANIVQRRLLIVSAVTPSPTPISKSMRKIRQVRQIGPITPPRIGLSKRRCDVARPSLSSTAPRSRPSWRQSSAWVAGGRIVHNANEMPSGRS